MISFKEMRQGIFFAAFIASLLVSQSVMASAQEKVVLTYRYATGFGPSDEPYQTAAEWMKRVTEQVDKQTKYKINFKVYAQSSLLKLNEMLPGIQDGRVDMGLIAPSLFPSQLPLSQIASIPFLSEDAIGTLKANRELATSNPDMANEWAKLGLVPVLFGPAQNSATSFKQPVKDIDDLKGKRIRAIGLHADALKAAGALPAAIPTSEVYQAVQTGVLDGFSGSPMGNQVTNQRIQEVAKYFVDLGLGQYTTAVDVVVRKSVWEKMPPEVQQIMTTTAVDVVEDFVPTNLTRLDVAACDAVKAAGGAVTRLPNDQIESWKAKVYDSILQKYIANAAKGSGLDAPAVKDFVGVYIASLNKFGAQKENYEDGMSVCGRRQ